MLYDYMNQLCLSPVSFSSGSVFGSFPINSWPVRMPHRPRRRSAACGPLRPRRWAWPLPSWWTEAEDQPVHPAEFGRTGVHRKLARGFLAPDTTSLGLA